MNAGRDRSRQSASRLSINAAVSVGAPGEPAASARAEENRGDRATRFDMSTEDLGQGRVARWKASRPGRRAHDAREGISRP
jgi:hypothetical protein